MKSSFEQLLEEVLKIEASGSAEPKHVTNIINKFLEAEMNEWKKENPLNGGLSDDSK
jgi:hypothetical protein